MSNVKEIIQVGGEGVSFATCIAERLFLFFFSEHHSLYSSKSSFDNADDLRRYSSLRSEFLNSVVTAGDDWCIIVFI